MPARRTAAATALAAVLVVVGVLAAAVSGPVSLHARTSDEPTWTMPAETYAATASPLPTPEPMGEPPTLPDWVQGLLEVLQWLAVVVGLLLISFLVRYLSRGWRVDEPGTADDDVAPGDEAGDEIDDTGVAALRAGVRQAEHALEDDVPPGDAVIGAWVAVETAAARTGVVRSRTQTTSEFTVRVLGATRADPAATRELLELYLAARFGAQGVDAADVERARELLGVVGRGLVARAGHGDAGDATDVDGTGPADGAAPGADGPATPGGPAAPAGRPS